MNLGGSGSNNGDFRSLIENVFKSRQKETALSLNVLKTHWSGIVGEELAAKTHPLRLEKKVLTIGAADACWVYELQFHKHTLLASVQAFLESDAVDDLRFKEGPLPEPAPQTFVHKATPPKSPAQKDSVQKTSAQTAMHSGRISTEPRRNADHQGNNALADALNRVRSKKSG